MHLNLLSEEKSISAGSLFHKLLSIISASINQSTLIFILA